MCDSGHERHDEVAIILDNGSRTCKAGFGGEDAPRAVFRTMLGRPRIPESMRGGLPMKDIYVGNEAWRSRMMLQCKYPVEHGIITNWDIMEKIWHHAFHDELRVAPEEHPVLSTEAPFNPTANRERMTEIMFETFGTPALCVRPQASLSLQAVGCTTGVVLDSGCTRTYAVPVLDGRVQTDAIQQLDAGGDHLTSHLMKIMSEAGYSLAGSLTCREMTEDMKEELCYVALDVEKHLEAAAVADPAAQKQWSYEYPCGAVVHLSDECCVRCTEALFKPSLLDVPSPGIHKAVHNAIAKCELASHKHLYANIVASGGNTTFRGFADRVSKEVAHCAPSGADVRVIAAEDRQHLAWRGGSVLSSLSGFKEMCVSRQDYDESGAPRVAAQST